jgi:glutamate racemase
MNNVCSLLFQSVSGIYTQETCFNPGCSLKPLKNILNSYISFFFFHMIGIFDSGIGGMTVARAVEKRIPDLPVCYLGDLARTPYGSKSDTAILEYSIENTEFLISQGAKVIVIACNSASSVATEKLRELFSLPIIEVITPAVGEALRQSRNGRIGIIGTSATIRNNVYAKQIHALHPEYQVHSHACPLLVPLVEEGWLNKRETKMILRRYLRPLKDIQLDTLVLGCTHYPLMKHLIQPRVGKRVRLIDSSETVAVYLKEYLRDNPQLISQETTPPVHRYFVTDLTATAQKAANTIFQRTIELIPA